MVRKVLHWERTDVLSRGEFQEQVISRVCRNLRNRVNRELRMGSFSSWRTSIQNMEAWLVTVVKNAARDETRSVLHLRNKGQKNYIRLLAAGLADLSSSSLLRVHDPTSFVLAFLRTKLPLRTQRDIVEHFRFCGPCFERLQAIKRLLSDLAQTGDIQPAAIPLVKLLGIKKETIEINLLVKNLLDREITYCLSFRNYHQSEEDRMNRVQFARVRRAISERNLKLLGCSQAQRKSLDRLPYGLLFQNRLTDIENRINGIQFLATGQLLAVQVCARLNKTRSFFLKKMIERRFDQDLTNAA